MAAVMHLLSHLFTYRATEARSPAEDFLSETFAEWLRLASASSLLPRVLSGVLGLPPGHGLPEGDDGRAIRWGTQHVIGPGYRGSGKRPDIVGQGPGFFLIIENKIGAAFTRHADEAGSVSQLELYLDYQQRQCVAAGGVVLLTHHTDAPDDWRQPVVSWTAIHRQLVALMPDLARRRDGDAAVLRYWTGQLIRFLEDHQMTGTRIELSDIIALPAFERLQAGMQALGSLAQKSLKGLVGGYTWQTLGVPRGWTSGDFTEPAFYGALMTLDSVKAHSADIVMWCGVLATEAYGIGPHIGGIPELSVGLCVWAHVAEDDPRLVALAAELARQLAGAAPNMAWTVRCQVNPIDDEIGVLAVQAGLSLIELHRLAGDDFWDDAARSFLVTAASALQTAAGPLWPQIVALLDADGDTTPDAAQLP